MMETTPYSQDQMMIMKMGGKGNDEIYAQDGDDALEGGPGADFDCGPGLDTVVDFSPNEGDITNDNCEDVRTNL